MVAEPKLIDERVSVKQCKLAVEALHAHETKKEQERAETELLPGKEPNVWLNVTVKQMPSGYKVKPAKIPIVHPLIDPRTTPICLITKDPQREYKDLLEQHNIKFISRVVGIGKLKGKFKPYEARRLLLKEYGLFLADERVIPLLPKLLGVKWFEAKKQPIPVCLTRKDLKGELERAVSATYLNQNKGTCTSIKIGVLSHKPSQILANLEKALPAVAKHIQGGWDNIQALHIKTNSSISLPIWTCNLDESEGGRWDGIAAPDAVGSEAGKDESSEEEEVPVVPVKKGKKRVQEDEETPTPKKKAKSDLISKNPETSSKEAKSSQKSVPSASKPSPKATDTSFTKEGKVGDKVTGKPRKSSIVAASESQNANSSIIKTSKKTPATVDSSNSARPKASAAPSGKAKSQSAAVSDTSKGTPSGKVKPSATKEATKKVTPKAALTAEEVKLKRSSEPGEKKKIKATASGTKSAKAALLGRKAGQGQ